MEDKVSPVGFSFQDVWIENPYLSECSRFSVKPSHYGFENVEAGGGCTALRKEIENGRYALLTDLGGLAAPDDTDGEYKMQCHARCDIFSRPEMKWNRLADIHYGSMTTKNKLAYLPNNCGLTESHFAADRDELVRQALAIIGQPAAKQKKAA